MKVKQRNVCQACRRRKLGCDGKSPECSQCVFSGLRCDGYPTDWKFLEHNASKSSNRRRGQANPVETKTATSLVSQQVHAISAGPLLPRQYLNQPNANHLSELIAQNFVPGSERATSISNSDYVVPRICGSWVEVLSILPCLNTGSLVLSRAIKALAASILSRPNMANTDCSSSYYDAIHALRKSFGVNGASVKFEMIPTAMCLAMAELMIPDSAAAIAEHIKAVGLLFQVYGPDVCKDGFPHKLFVGFRPLLTIQAILHRHSTFLASPAWIYTPFSTFGPSLMQQLLNEAVTLPSLLHQADLLIKDSELTINSHINQVFSSFVDLTSRLGNWETMLCVESRPTYWHSGNASDDTILPLWYPNITMANVFTHLWALQIICKTEIKRLSSYLPRSSRELYPQLASRIDENDLLMIALARKIYTSMDYLLQDEMELFGPASTFFPLRVAHQIFIADESAYKMDIVYIEGIVNRLARKGLLSVHSFVFDM